MPVYNLVCSTCSRARKKLSTVTIKSMAEDEYEAFMLCECGGTLKRDPNPPTATVKESLDNGAMRRRVERFKDAERLYKERAKGGPK